MSKKVDDIKLLNDKELTQEAKTKKQLKEEAKAAAAAEQAKKDAKAKKKNKKKSKETRAGNLGRKTKETFAELKKVTWPTWGKVLAQTGVVLVVVGFFTLALFGMDYLLKFLHTLIIK